MTIETGKHYNLHTKTTSVWGGAEVVVLERLGTETNAFAAVMKKDLYDFEIVDKETYPPFDDDEEHDEDHPYRGLAFAEELVPVEK